MRRQCAWCKRFGEDKPPYDDERISHGICADCAAAQGITLPGAMRVRKNPKGLKTLYIHSARGRIMSTVQAHSWKALARMYGEIMKRNRHLATADVRVTGNSAHVQVRGA